VKALSAAPTYSKLRLVEDVEEEEEEEEDMSWLFSLWWVCNERARPTLIHPKGFPS
jgi:hypothetical protein